MVVGLPPRSTRSSAQRLAPSRGTGYLISSVILFSAVGAFRAPSNFASVEEASSWSAHGHACFSAHGDGPSSTGRSSNSTSVRSAGGDPATLAAAM